MSEKNLLVELFVEELPPRSLKKLGNAFSSALAASLKQQGLAAQDAIVMSYASPRRLALSVKNVSASAEDRSVLQKLMRVKVGLDDKGEPTPALLKKLASLGVDGIPELRRAMDGKAEALYFESVVQGAKLKEGLQSALQDAIEKLPIAKVMTYPNPAGDGWDIVNFLRPAHGLLALHGSEIVPVSALGLMAGNKTRGHRFEAATDTIVIRDADSYEEQMKSEGAVIASFAARRSEIERQLAEAAGKLNLKPIEDEALLDEVTALVERPNVLVGTFDVAFLAVPQECLILTMKANQKYFPLLDAKGKLTNKFLIVSNIRPIDASLVTGGNERVVRPRLADAKFFFDQDRKKPLDARVLGLSKVVYHNKLGSQGERVERVQAIARSIGFQLGGEELARLADRAALLAKADLLTDMVGEFPELQGIMGRYYAKHDGEHDDIAYAIEDHYRPRFAGDELPRNQVGTCVALADKLETLTGLFGIGERPTGDKDPFALRRHALGIIRILIEKELPLELGNLLKDAFGAFPSGLLGYAHSELETFVFERLGGMMREQGYTAQEVDAVLSMRIQNFSDATRRLAAVRVFAVLPEAEALSAANKRVGNILKKAEGDTALRQAQGERAGNAEGERTGIDASLLKEPAESALHQALEDIAPRAEAAFAAGDYTTSLQALASLRSPVDAFFDSVMVNAEDPKLRANRLTLLSRLHHAMNRIADISRLAT